MRLSSTDRNKETPSSHHSFIMSCKLKTLQGDKLSKPVDGSISHAFFIRHLKLYSSSEGQQGIKVALTHQMIDDMGLSMAAKKTKTISLARKTLVCDVGLRPSDDVMIEDLVDSLTKDSWRGRS